MVCHARARCRRVSLLRPQLRSYKSTESVGQCTLPFARYTSNNEVRQEFSIVFTAKPIRGELRSSSESSEPQWVSPAAIPGLQMHPSMRQRIQHYLDQWPAPYLGSTASISSMRPAVVKISDAARSTNRVTS